MTSGDWSLLEQLLEPGEISHVEAPAGGATIAVTSRTCPIDDPMRR
jgi:hypothetical protein